MQIAAMDKVCRRLELVPWTETPNRSPKFWLDLVLNLASPFPYMAQRYCYAPLRARICQLLEREPPDVLLCDFLQPSMNVWDLDFRPKVLFAHNVEAQIGKRHAERAGNPAARLFWGRQWRKLHWYEGEAMRRFDHVITVSAEDSALMRQDYGVSHSTPVPLGVDTVEYAPGDEPRLPGRLVFTGSMDWLPNADGLSWFVSEVLPLIRERRPGVTLDIVGRNPAPRVRALGAEPGIEVTGAVPDVKPYVRRAEVVIVPLRIGGGTRIKIFEAMSLGAAIVSTRLGAEGLPVEDGGDLLLADEPEAFAAAVVSLLEDPAQRARLGAAGRAKMVAHYGWDQAARVFIDTLAAVAKGV